MHNEDKTLRAYTTTEVAALLDTTEKTVRRLIARGALSAFRVGRHWRIAHTELERFQREGGAR